VVISTRVGRYGALARIQGDSRQSACYRLLLRLLINSEEVIEVLERKDRKFTVTLLPPGERDFALSNAVCPFSELLSFGIWHLSHPCPFCHTFKHEVA
jgi:hypothetical protein